MVFPPKNKPLECGNKSVPGRETPRSLEYQRLKREYVKRKESFWIEGGTQEAAKKVPCISTVEPQQNQTTAKQETLSLAQLAQLT